MPSARIGRSSPAAQDEEDHQRDEDRYDDNHADHQDYTR